MKVIGFTGDSSTSSINKELVKYALSLFDLVETEFIDINDFFTEPYIALNESVFDIPENVTSFAKKLDSASLLVISLAEQTGSNNSTFNNMYEWLSRIPNRKVFANKPILLLATTPDDDDGGEGILKTASTKFSSDGSEIWDTFSLPNFRAHLDKDGVASMSLRISLIRKVNYITYNKLKLKNPNYYTCGIDSQRDPCGDASEY